MLGVVSTAALAAACSLVLPSRAGHCVLWRVAHVSRAKLRKPSSYYSDCNTLKYISKVHPVCYSTLYPSLYLCIQKPKIARKVSESYQIFDSATAPFSAQSRKYRRFHRADNIPMQLGPSSSSRTPPPLARCPRHHCGGHHHRHSSSQSFHFSPSSSQ